MVTDRKPRLEGFEERELEWRGTRLRYAVGGDGPPLVLLHGLGGTIENWRALAPPLAAAHRIVVPDLPGHGRSAPLPEARDLDALAEAVLAIADAEEMPGAVWIGHSLGGVVALRTAALRPEAVRGLVLAAAAGIGSASRAAQVTLAVLGVARPGRLIAPYRHAWAHSRLGRRAAFGWWGVADADALAPELAEAFLVGLRTTPTRARPAGPCSSRTRASSSTASPALASASGERATTGSASRTGSSTRAACARPYGRSPVAATS